MPVTADDIYQLIKSYEGQFQPPAPYFNLTVGTFDVDSGAFTGFSTRSETDPEPVPHQPGQVPHSPRPFFEGTEYVSVSISAQWRKTTTFTPAPKVPLQPVLLVFQVTRALDEGWSVEVNGITASAAPGATSVAVDIWDANHASWSIAANNLAHGDSLMLQRPAGSLGGALGVFTIPVLPVTIVYAPPTGSLGGTQSTASYLQGQTVGQTTTFDTSTDTSTTVPLTVTNTATFGQMLNYTAGALGEAAKAASGAAAGYMTLESGLFSNFATELGKLDASTTSGITDTYDTQMTVSETTGTGLTTGSQVGGPGVGDLFHYLHKVRMGWSYYAGGLRLVPLGYTDAAYPASALQNPGSIGLSPSDAAALLAFDPFVAGGASAPLPDDRFQIRQNWEYGDGAIVTLSDSVTRDTKTTNTEATYTTQSSEWDAGPILKSFGLGSKETSTLKVTNATGTDISDTVTLSANLVSGPGQYFVVNLYYDTLFGTFAFQLGQAAAAARVQGKSAKPGEVISLDAKGKVFRTVADKSGAYAFRNKAIPSGTAMVTAGSGLREMVEVAA